MGPGDWIAVVGIVVTVSIAIVKGVSMVLSRSFADVRQGVKSANEGMTSIASDMGEIKAGVEYLREEQRKTGEAFGRVWQKFDEHDNRLWELAHGRKIGANS